MPRLPPAARPDGRRGGALGGSDDSGLDEVREGLPPLFLQHAHALLQERHLLLRRAHQYAVRREKSRSTPPL